MACLQDGECCCCPKESGRKELWRLRVNWAFITSLALLACLSIQSVASSFHQFVTNPRNTGNSSQTTVQEYGLGESEQFYSALLAVLNIGAIFGGVMTGFLVKCLPYWHLFIWALLVHIISFVLYAVTYQGWVIMISKFLSGYYLGASRSLALSYATSSSVLYVKAIKHTGEESEEHAAARIRDYLFTGQALGICLGFFIGPGVAFIFAQFPIDQFRGIAWFNVVVGAVLLLCGILFFCGESECDKIKNCSNVCKFRDKFKSTKKAAKCGAMQIITSLFALSIAIGIKLTLFETLYNPILSDSFGLTERGLPLFFFSLAIPEVVGVVLLFVLQKLKVSNQIISLISIGLIFVGCLLFGDWQTIPYDPCTERSPYHHPDLINLSSLLGLQYPSSKELVPTMSSLPTESTVSTMALARISLHPGAHLAFQDGSSLKSDIFEEASLQLSCEQVKNCLCKKRQRCIRLSSNGQIAHAEETPNTTGLIQFLCSSGPNPPLVPMRMSVCLQYDRTDELLAPDRNNSTGISSIQSVAVLPKVIYPLARNYCEEASGPNRQCRWLPMSSLTNKDCNDCPAICRSKTQTINFAQFVIGAFILMGTSPSNWVSSAAMVTYQSPKELQEITMGAFVALVFFGRSIGPLILDISYEGVQKRTFLTAILLIGIFVPFFIEILVLYPKLGPPRKKRQKELKE